MTLREWLKYQGWTVSEFSRRLGVSRSSIYNWMANKKNPSKYTVLRIKKLTDGKVKILCDGKKNNNKANSCCSAPAKDN